MQAHIHDNSFNAKVGSRFCFPAVFTVGRYEINHSYVIPVFCIISIIIEAVYTFIQMMNKILTEPTVTKEPVFNFQNPSKTKTCNAKL